MRWLINGERGLFPINRCHQRVVTTVESVLQWLPVEVSNQ